MVEDDLKRLRLKRMEGENSLCLSIIVPVYNVEQYLERCVNSLLDQDLPYSDYEIILINDGSTDNSYQVAKRLTQDHSNIILLSQENKGQSVARNVGLEYVRGKYTMFVDSDDFFSTNVIGQLIELSEKEKLDLCFYRTVFEYVDGSQRIGSKQNFCDYTIYDGEFLLLHGMRVSSVWQNVYSTQFLLSTGIRFYERILHEDVEFCYRLYPYAKRIMFTDMIAYHYCVYGESSTRTNCPNKVKYILQSDFHVASNLKKYSNDLSYSDEVRMFYAKTCNSIVVATLLQLIRNDTINTTLKLECLMKAKNLGVYPLSGKTNSKKTTLLAKLFNVEPLVQMIIRLTYNH